MNRHDRLVDSAAHEGAAIVRDIIEDYAPLDRDDIRCQVVLFSVFANTIQRLHLRGMTEREMISEVFEHCALARFIASMDDEE